MIKVGQKLFCVFDSKRDQNAEVTVVKVGRKWAHLQNSHRIDVGTLEIDGAGYASPGKCYLSEADYNAEKELNMEWLSMRRDIEKLYRTPKGMTLEKINQIRNILNGGNYD